MPVFEGTATQNGNKVHFKWQDNSGMGNAEDTDIAMLLVYNKDEETAVYDTEATLRSARHAELQLPSDWQDDELIAYLSFRSADGSCVANSIRLTVTVDKTDLPAPDQEASALCTSSDRIPLYPKPKQPVINNVSVKDLTYYTLTGKPFQSRLYGTG